MLLRENLVQETYYDVLSVKEDATYEEIRTNYRSAILSSHPDKLNNSYETSHSNNAPYFRFLKIQKAWEILGDAKSRAAYDNDLQASRQDAVTADEISIEDMMVEDAREVFELYYQCRCGDYFSVDSLEMGNLGYELFTDGNEIGLRKSNSLPASIVLPCGSCSLRIRLWVNADIKIPLKDDKS